MINLAPPLRVAVHVSASYSSLKPTEYREEQVPENWLISADSHVIEPVDLWSDALGNKWGDAVPREVQGWQGQDGRFYYTGIESFKLGELVEGEGELQQKIFSATEDPGLL